VIAPAPDGFTNDRTPEISVTYDDPQGSGVVRPGARIGVVAGRGDVVLDGWRHAGEMDRGVSRVHGQLHQQQVSQIKPQQTAFSLQAAILSHSHLINHAAGWLEGGLVASFEKIVVDAELLRSWADILKPIEFDDDDLAVEAIKGVEPGGHFFGTAHTLARYEKAFYRPLLSDWSNFENWTEAGAKDATRRATDVWKRLLAEYSPPPLDAAVREAVVDYVARRSHALGCDAQ
jgi:hypothetical protein